MKERAFAEAAAALKAGEIVAIFPEGKLTATGELNTFRPGLQRILEQAPVPVIPMALRGLWGSLFSRRSEGSVIQRLRHMSTKIALVVGAPVAPEMATLPFLEQRVLALRGDRR